MKNTYKFFIYMLFVFAMIKLNIINVKAESSYNSHCLYSSHDISYNNLYMIYTIYDEELSSGCGSFAMDFYINGNVYHTIPYWSDGKQIQSGVSDIKFKNPDESRPCQQPVGFIVGDNIINYRKDPNDSRKYIVYAYYDNDEIDYMIDKINQEGISQYYTLPVSNSFDNGCITYDYHDKNQVKAAYNLAKGTRLESMFEQIVESKPEMGDPSTWTPVETYEPEVGDLECESLLGSPTTEGTPAYLLTFVFKIVRYIAIMILIVFSIIDFVSAAASHDDDELKKAMEKTIKRFVLCIVIFLLPMLISFVLGIIHNNEIDLCVSTKI